MTTARLYVASKPATSVPVGIDVQTGLRVLEADFIGDLGCRVPDLERWWLARQGAPLAPGVGRVWVSRSERSDPTTVLRVPAGTVYNGASLPPLALVRLLMGPRELYEAASVFHDDLYGEQAPRAAADLVFWIIARSGSKQVTEARGQLGWLALRAFGWWAYWRAGR